MYVQFLDISLGISLEIQNTIEIFIRRSVFTQDEGDRDRFRAEVVAIFRCDWRAVRL